jgi:MoxR-like ATPase
MSPESQPAPSNEQRIQEFIQAFQALRAEVRKVIVGHDDVITHVLIGLFAGGHVLLEGVPGLGKTLPSRRSPRRST